MKEVLADELKNLATPAEVLNGASSLHYFIHILLALHCQTHAGNYPAAVERDCELAVERLVVRGILRLHGHVYAAHLVALHIVQTGADIKLLVNRERHI